jgi:hypothetical protein
MIEFDYYQYIPSDFTGVCQVLATNYIYHMKDGKFHNEFGPAMIYPHGDKFWFINDVCHREDGPACEYADGQKHWYYKGKTYGYGNAFTIETWMEKVRELKLEIFK